MCRLFGFRSVVLSQVHQSLVQAENALIVQSEAHPHGWGVGYYIADAPHMIKSAEMALEDNIFKRVSGVVSSLTVIAHLRKATIGKHTILNTHPFQYGKWMFAHNGNIKDFERHRSTFERHLEPSLRRFVLGTTDSEILFFLLLSTMMKSMNIHGRCDAKIIALAIENTVKLVESIAGPLNSDVSKGPMENYLTFVLTNGQQMFGFNGGQELFFSTHKVKCPERDTCASYNPVCEMAVDSGRVNHLIFASEPLSGTNVWRKMGFRQLIYVDEGMQMFGAGRVNS